LAVFFSEQKDELPMRRVSLSATPELVLSPKKYEALDIHPVLVGAPDQSIWAESTLNAERCFPVKTGALIPFRFSCCDAKSATARRR
jgi:hypothetical protein